MSEKQIRVLQVVTHMRRGGLETMLMNYYRHIDREKIQFDFLVHRDYESHYDAEILSMGGKIFHISRLIPWSANYKNKLKYFLEDHPEYQIIHVHQDCLSSVILKCAREKGIPVRVAHSHNANQDRDLKYPIKLFYRRSIPKYATDLFACGKDAGDWMFRGANYSIMANAIPAKDYSFSNYTRDKIRTELKLFDEFAVGLVASFTVQKNHVFLLDIFNELLKKEPSARLLLVGEGQLRTEIEKRVCELGIKDQVILTGIRGDVPDLLQAMDAFIMPSNYEGLSLASVEAQAAGLPCFISDKVPIECKKTDLVQQISLSESPEYWADCILKTKGLERRNMYSEIVDSGFDIEENAKWLQKFYLEKVGR